MDTKTNELLQERIKTFVNSISTDEFKDLTIQLAYSKLDNSNNYITSVFIGESQNDTQQAVKLITNN